MLTPFGLHGPATAASCCAGCFGLCPASWLQRSSCLPLSPARGGYGGAPLRRVAGFSRPSSQPAACDNGGSRADRRLRSLAAARVSGAVQWYWPARGRSPATRTLGGPASPEASASSHPTRAPGATPGSASPNVGCPPAARAAEAE